MDMQGPRSHGVPDRPGHRLRAIAAVALLALGLLLPSPVAAQGDSRPLVIDTDLGPGDVMALAWLIDEPALDIRAVTVSGTGAASCAAGVAFLRALLVALEATGPAVGCGSTVPIAGGTPFPLDRRAAADAGHGLELPPAPDAEAPWLPAEDTIRAILDETTDHVSFLSLGPLTTLASVFADPDMAVRVGSLTAALGALAVPGDVVPPDATAPGAAEWNAHADPGAVDAVLASGVPLTLVTLDAAAQVPLSQTLLDGLRAGGESPSARLVGQLLAVQPSLGEPGFLSQDALAAVVLTERAVIETRERQLVVTPDGPDAGALRESEEDGLPAQVAIGADRTAFELALLSGLRGLEGAAGTPAAALLTIAGDGEACTFDPGAAQTPGVAVIRAVAGDEPLVAVLAELAAGYGIADLEALLTTSGPTEDPPEWLLLAAFLEAEPGSMVEDTAELAAGDYVAICVTGVQAATYLVAPTVLTITG